MPISLTILALLVSSACCEIDNVSPVERNVEKRLRPAKSSVSLTVADRMLNFNLEAQSTATISYTISELCSLKCTIYDRSPSEVRTLFNEKSHDPGDYTAEWDGKDAFGVPVPNGYYFVRLTDTGTSEIFFDSAMQRWGEPSNLSGVQFQLDGKISYHLSYNSVLRVGVVSVKSGAYLGSIRDWIARPAGHHYELWDGYDSADKISLITRQDLEFKMIAYTLPPATIFVTGSKIDSIPVTLEGSEYVVPPESDDVLLFARQDSRTAASPSFELHAHDEAGELFELHDASVGTFVHTHAVLSGDSAAVFKDHGYAVKVYLDDELVAEVEQADNSFVYEFDPESIAPGKHLLNYNVISHAGGHVGAELREFTVVTADEITARKASNKSTLQETSAMVPLSEIRFTTDNKESIDLAQGEFLVALLSATCDHCMSWVSRLNDLASDEKLPTVIALMMGNEQEKVTFESLTSPAFSSTLVSISTFMTLIGTAPPRLLLLRDGDTVAYWDNSLPSRDDLLKAADQ